MNSLANDIYAVQMRRVIVIVGILAAGSLMYLAGRHSRPSPDPVFYTFPGNALGDASVRVQVVVVCEGKRDCRVFDVHE